MQICSEGLSFFYDPKLFDNADSLDLIEGHEVRISKILQKQNIEEIGSNLYQNCFLLP
jgi:hypothetical protein